MAVIISPGFAASSLPSYSCPRLAKNVYNDCVKALALLLCAAGVCLAQGHEVNFVIRFEPRAVLQANAVIPFEIRVNDDRHQPVIGATVTLQIETSQHTRVKVFNAPSVDQGVYIAKPVFPSSGEWSVYVEVNRNGQMSARTIEFNVPESAAP